MMQIKNIKPLFVDGIFFAAFRLIVALGILVLSGCAEFNPSWSQGSSDYNGAYAQTDFDELLSFGENMVKMPSSTRAKQCRSLQKHQGLTRIGIVLHLMVGRLLSDGCGEVSKILAELQNIPLGSLDTRTQKLVAIDTEALKRISSSPKKSSSAECKQKATHSGEESKSTKGSNKSDARLLREKLEAIRTMEKQIDESGDVK